MDGLNDDYDTPWKLAVTRYFPDFIAFYFPRAHAAIDWSHPHVFLDEELAQLTHDAALGKRLLDKLVQAHTLDVRAGHGRAFADPQDARRRGPPPC